MWGLYVDPLLDLKDTIDNHSQWKRNLQLESRTSLVESTGIRQDYWDVGRGQQRALRGVR